MICVCALVRLERKIGEVVRGEEMDKNEDGRKKRRR
jgi:hypothetical protein